MQAVLGMRRLPVGSVEVVRRPRHVAVGGPFVRLPGAPSSQRRVGAAEAATHLREALVSGIVEPALGLRSPERVLLGDQILDLVQDRLLVHELSISPVSPGAAAPTGPGHGRAEPPA